MLANLDASSIVFALTAVAIFSYPLGSILDGMVADDAFGVTGNVIVITAGFFVGIFTANHWGFRFNDPLIGICVGLCGAFMSLWVLSVLKAGLRKAFT